MNRSGVWCPASGRAWNDRTDNERPSPPGSARVARQADDCRGHRGNGWKEDSQSAIGSPTHAELRAAAVEVEDFDEVFHEIPFGIPESRRRLAAAAAPRAPFHCTIRSQKMARSLHTAATASARSFRQAHATRDQRATKALSRAARNRRSDRSLPRQCASTGWLTIPAPLLVARWNGEDAKYVSSFRNADDMGFLQK